MKRAIIIKGKAFDWDGAKERADELINKDRVEAAAAAMDPGVMHCPKCLQWFWNEGEFVQCTECGCTFPTDWSLALRLGLRGNVIHKYGAQLYTNEHWFFKFGYEHHGSAKDAVIRLVSFAYQPTGADRIVLERLEQIHKHKWTPEHDDQHVNGKMLDVAQCLMIGVEDCWGIHERVHKNNKLPYDQHIKCLTVAGALIAAEIDRVERSRCKNATE